MVLGGPIPPRSAMAAGPHDHNGRNTEPWLTFCGTSALVDAKRLNSSSNGNPRYLITFDDGSEVITQSDAAINYGITNHEYRDQPHDAELSRAGRLVYLRKPAT